MKKLLLLSLVGAFAWVASALDLNGSWEFRFEEGKPLAEAADASFTATDTIPVPGCFDAMPKWYLKRGTGLYRRTFTLDADVENAYLTIDGMGLVGSFAIDGRSLGVHPYPYARLVLPTGPLAKGEHTLFAALDNRFDWSQLTLARPYYDFYLYGGFYHGVSLSFSDAGVFVRTRDWRTGEVELELRGKDMTDGSYAVAFDGGVARPVTFANRRARLRVPAFKPWSPESPALHRVTVKGTGGSATARFGIRTVEARDKQLWLNGKPLYLKGMNRHEAHPTFGSATPEAIMLTDIQNVKALGGNFIRGAHYQQSQRFLDLCDENGILVWEEALGWGNGQTYTDKEQVEFSDPRFLADQVHTVKGMVEASFNHPSVIIFAYMNEFNSATDRGKEISDALISAIRGYDSGRLVSFACNLNDRDICNANTDFVSFNTYPGWIGSDPEDPQHLRNLIQGNLDEIIRYHRGKWGDKPIIVSEMGTCGEYGRHDPAGAQWTEEFQAEYLTSVMDAVFARPDIAGFTIWQLTDCRSYHRGGASIRGKPFAENLAGLYDGYRRAKLQAVKAVRDAFTRQAASRPAAK